MHRSNTPAAAIQAAQDIWVTWYVARAVARLFGWTI